jgi:hypothetical protein
MHLHYVQVHFRTSVTMVAIKPRGLSGAQRWTRLTLPLLWIEPLLRYCSFRNILQEKLFFGCLTQTSVLNYHSKQISKLHIFSVCPRTFLSFITKVTNYEADILLLKKEAVVMPNVSIYNYANLRALANFRFPFFLWPPHISHLSLERGKGIQNIKNGNSWSTMFLVEGKSLQTRYTCQTGGMRDSPKRKSRQISRT